MKQLAFALILVFALNLLSEIFSGDCHEGGQEPEINYGLNQIHPGEPQTPDPHKDHPHLCHFGHCGHLLLFSETQALTRSPAMPAWLRRTATPPSRYLSPPYKPPIA